MGDKQWNEKGAALVTTLMFLFAMGILSTALVFTVNKEMNTSASFKYNQQAFYVSNAAVERAVQWFNDPTSYSPHTPNTSYDPTKSPVVILNTENPVRLAGREGYRSYFPDTNTGGIAVLNNFAAQFSNQGNAVQTVPDTNGYGQFALNATLMSYRPANFININTMVSYAASIERWKLDSFGFWGSTPLAVSQITTMIENDGNALWDRALWGKNSVTLQGGSLIDSYDPTQPLGSANGGLKGAIGSNGDITGGGNMTVKGAIGYGPNGTLDLGSNVNHVGDTVHLAQERYFAPVPDFTVGAADLTVHPANPHDPFTAITESTNGGRWRDWNVNGVLRLGPGTYYVDSLTVTGEIQITGETHLYVKSDLSIAGSGVVNFGAVNPLMKIFYSGESVARMRGSSTVAFEYYGPDADLDLMGSNDFYGSFIGYNVRNVGGAAVHFDEGSLERDLVQRPFRIVTWSQNSL